MNDLDRLAQCHGVALSYFDHAGERQDVPDTTKRAVLASLGIDVADSEAIRRSLATAPPVPPPTGSIDDIPACFMPDWLENGRVWGVSMQVYQLRSDRNAGMGDFEDLAVAAETLARQGADFLGTNPLHALFLANPAHCSPFSPSNRRFLNPLYIAIDRVLGFEPLDVDKDVMAACRRTELVDYVAVAELKLAALRRIWARWQGDDESFADGKAALASFRDNGGVSLRQHALFEAISMHLAAHGHGAGWTSWPAEFQGPEAAGTVAFSRDHAGEVEFQVWLQWLADRQLLAAQARAKAAGMRIGLYLDLAVGEAPDGSATWSDPELSLVGVSVGAPPDPFNMDGQNWGLAPISPQRLRERAAAPLRDMLAAVTRHAGALRIDHVMALMHLYFVPASESAKRGTYVQYPLADMLAAVADASHAVSAVVVGEDLGTVPPRIREIMAAAEIQSYRVFYFERDGQHLRMPEHYPQKALACLSTHDLQPLLGWWWGDDIRLRLELGHIDAAAERLQHEQRAADRTELVQVLRRANLIDDATVARLNGRELDEDATIALCAATHAFVAQTPSRLFVVRLDDLAAERAPVNMPGVVDEYPNWRRKLPMSIDEVIETPLHRAIVERVVSARPRAS